MELQVIKIEKPDDVNFILGQSHFIKTVEDIHEVLVATVPQIEFGLAFCEASGPALLRVTGTSDAMIELAKKNGMALAVGHSFILFLGNAFPVNILNAIKNVPEVAQIFCATANPTEVIIVETELGRGILGVVDGTKTQGIETAEDVTQRKEFLRKIGYKF